MRTEMTHRERVKRILNHEEADRVPFDLGFGPCGMTEDSYWKLKRHLDLNERVGEIEKDWLIVTSYDEVLLEKFDIDFRRIYLGSPRNWNRVYNPDGTWRDKWGILRKKVSYCSEMIDSPLSGASTEDLECYPWPDYTDPGLVEGLEDKVKDLYFNTDYALVGPPVGPGGLFETAQWLRGMENFLIDLILDKSFAKKLLEKLLEIQIGFLTTYLDIVGPFIEIMEYNDDFGTQQGLLIAPKLYREMIRPCHKEIIGFIKSKTKAKVFQHTCGAVYDLIEDLIDIGVDILNPVQPKAAGMDSYRLKRDFGNRLVFHGGVDVQEVLPTGTKADVEEEVRTRLRAFALGGGYILAASQIIQYDIPPENVVTMFEAAKKWGQYPIG